MVGLASEQFTKLDKCGCEDPDEDYIGHLHPRPLHMEDLEVLHRLWLMFLASHQGGQQGDGRWKSRRRDGHFRGDWLESSPEVNLR